MLLLAALFWVSLVMVIMIATIPVGRFLLYQWGVRRQEFLNRLGDKSLAVYLARFYRNTVTQAPGVGLANTPPQAAGDGLAEFKKIYDDTVGRRLYAVPLALFIVILILFGGLVIEAAIREGYEQYISFYQSWLEQEKLGSSVQLSHLSLETLNASTFPFPKVALTLQALALNHPLIFHESFQWGRIACPAITRLSSPGGTTCTACRCNDVASP